MKKLAILLGAVVVGSTSARGAYTPLCGQEFKRIRQLEYLDHRAVQVKNRQQETKKLSSFEQKALQEYRKILELDRDEDLFFVVSRREFLRNEQVEGMLIHIDQNQDEDRVTFTMDAQGRILFWYWAQQSPEKRWVCEGYNPEII